MNEKKIILDKLVTFENFFDLIELSKTININLKEYFDFCPNININWNPQKNDNNYDDNCYHSIELYNIKEFALENKKNIQTDPIIFLQNIEEVSYIKFNSYGELSICHVNNGEYCKDDEEYRSIEFEYHNTNGYAYENKRDPGLNFYAINEQIYSEQQYKQIIRELKLKKLTIGIR